MSTFYDVTGTAETSRGSAPLRGEIWNRTGSVSMISLSYTAQLTKGRVRVSFVFMEKNGWTRARLCDGSAGGKQQRRRSGTAHKAFGDLSSFPRVESIPER